MLASAGKNKCPEACLSAAGKKTHRTLVSGTHHKTQNIIFGVTAAKSVYERNAFIEMYKIIVTSII